jgi:hypothetical protein
MASKKDIRKEGKEDFWCIYRESDEDVNRQTGMGGRHQMDFSQPCPKSASGLISCT